MKTKNQQVKIIVGKMQYKSYPSIGTNTLTEKKMNELKNYIVIRKKPFLILMTIMIKVFYMTMDGVASFKIIYFPFKTLMTLL